MQPKVLECDGEPFFELTHAMFDCVASWSDDNVVGANKGSLRTTGRVEKREVHTFDVEVLDELLFLFGRVFAYRLGYFHVVPRRPRRPRRA